MPKMAVYQPRRAAIATILVAVMQDDICEELLGRHKRGRTKEWIRRREEKGLYRLVEELRAEDTVAYKEMMRMNFETFSEILMAIEPEISKEQVIGGHKIIKPAVRLTLALRFLATGETFTSLHFLTFSLSASLLFLTGRWQCGSHIALSPPWLPPLTEKTIVHYHPLGQTKKPS